MSNQNSWFTTDNARYAHEDCGYVLQVSPPCAVSKVREVRANEHRWWRRAAVVSAVFFAAAIPAGAQAKPCEKHEGSAKAACIKQAKRDAMPYPPNPSWAEAARRVGPEQLAIAKRVSACEEPGSEHGTGRGRSPWPRYWSLSGGTYVSGFGMAASTWRWAASDTGYPAPPAATPAMQLLVAVHGGRDLFGWAGWSCF